MKIASFDIFDTCLVRKCGTPQNMLDVLSLRVFSAKVKENIRQEFISYRRIAEESLFSNHSATIHDIYELVPHFHDSLKSKAELIATELEVEKMLLLPVRSIKQKIDVLRNKGFKIIFISDMYLPSSFLREVLKLYDLFMEGDGIYVSAECNAINGNGTLFKYVKDKESIHYSNWTHYGDNVIADYSEPKKLGIKSIIINHDYNYYPQYWIEHNYSSKFKYQNILAGLCRAIKLSNEWNKQVDFITDIILPYSVSLVNNWLNQAKDDGISKLFFCSRDTYHLYEIAKILEPYYPSITCHYLFISRKSLLEGNEEAMMLYLKQIGLATKSCKVGIADVRSSGRTQSVLNQKLSKYNFNSVKGYYFEMFTTEKIQYTNEYYCEVNKIYIQHNKNSSRLLSNWQLYEDYFSMNNTPKTVDYKIESDKAYPVFSETDDHEHSYINNALYYQSFHQDLLKKFTVAYIQLGLINFSNEVSDLAISTLMQFFACPSKAYLPALEEFYAFSWTHGYVPYVGKLSLFKLVLTNAKTNIWRRGTITNSLPNWLINILYRLKS